MSSTPALILARLDAHRFDLDSARGDLGERHELHQMHCGNDASVAFAHNQLMARVGIDLPSGRRAAIRPASVGHGAFLVQFGRASKADDGR